mgnify:FL=1
MMIQLFGGKEEFVAALDDIFNTDAEIHGNLVDITGLIGQYVHGNELVITSLICTIMWVSLGKHRKCRDAC